MSRHPYRWIAVLVAMLYLPWLSAAPLHGVLESHRLVVAREMLRSGEWIVPMLHGEAYLNKPPLQSWLIALASLPFGDVSIASGRLVSALSMLGLALAVAWFGKRELGPRVGFLAAAWIAGAGLCVEKGTRAELEALLAASTTVAILAVFDATWRDRFAWKPIVVGAVALGAAVLTKGPVPLLPFALALAAIVWSARGRRAIALRRALALVGAALAIPAAWVVAVAVRLGASSVETFVHETTFRVTSPGPTNVAPGWFYAPALLAALLPATLWLPGLAGMRSRFGELSPRRASLHAMLAALALGVPLLLSLSEAKETRYLIAALPAWTLWIAWGFSRARREPWMMRYQRGLAAGAWAIAWLAPVALIVVGAMAPRASVAAVLAGAAALLVLALASRASLDRRSVAAFALSIATAACVVNTLAASVALGAEPERDGSRRIGREIASIVRPDDPIVQVGEFDSELAFWSDRCFGLARKPVMLDGLLESPRRPRWVLARERFVDDLVEDGLEPVASWGTSDRSWMLWRVPAHDVGESP